MKIIKKLFGENEQEQYDYLMPRLSALGISIVVMLIGILLCVIGIGNIGIKIGQFGMMALAVVLLNLGWAVVKVVWKCKTFIELISNMGIYVAPFLLVYVFFGYFVGIIVAIIGICKFLVILKNRRR